MCVRCPDSDKAKEYGVYLCGDCKGEVCSVCKSPSYRLKEVEVFGGTIPACTDCEGQWKNGQLGLTEAGALYCGWKV